MSRTQMLDWNALTTFVSEDIDMARDAKKGDPITNIGSNVLWDRDMRSQ